MRVIIIVLALLFIIPMFSVDYFTSTTPEGIAMYAEAIGELVGKG